MKKIVITGGAGFIGSHIATSFADDGWQVVAFDNLETGYAHNLTHLGDRVQLVVGDVRDRQALAQVMQGATLVAHHAAVVSVPYSVENPYETEQVNAQGTLNVILAARDAGVERATIAVSAAAYGDDPGLPKTEDMPPCPISPYASTKLANELQAGVATRCYGLPVFALRYFNIYGARQDPSGAYAAVISKFAERMTAGTAPIVFGDGGQTRDFCHVSDVVRANRLALQSAHADRAGRPINIGTGTRTSLLDLVAAFNDLLGTAFEVDHRPPRLGDIRHSVADISRAKDWLGYGPQATLRDGLQDLLNSLEKG